MAIDVETKQFVYEKRLSKTKEDLKSRLQESEIQDTKLKRLYEELLDAEDESYQKVLKSYISKYKELNKKSSNISESQLQIIDDIDSQFSSLEKQQQKMEKITKQSRQKEQALDPTAFVSEFGMGFKSAMKQGKGIFGSIKEGAGSSVSQLKESGKTLASFKNLSKSLLHVAGVITDLPALNILASEIGSDDSLVKDAEAKRKALEVIESVKSERIESSFDSSRFEKESSFDSSRFEKESMSDSSSSISNKESTTNNNERFETRGDTKNEETAFDVRVSTPEEQTMDLDPSKTNDTELYLEHIEENTFDIARTLKSYIAMQKDWRDDSMFSDSGAINDMEAGVGGPISKMDKANPLDDLAMLGGGLFGGGDVSGNTKGKYKGGKRSKGLLRNLSKAGNFFKGFLGKVAFPLTVAFATYDAFKGIEKANEVYNLEEGQEATITQKATSAFGNVLETITFGLVDNTKETGDAITNFIKNWTPIGIVSTKLADLFTDDDSDELVNQLEKSRIVDTSLFGKSRIRDWSKIEELSAKQIDAVMRYDDWDETTTKRLEEIKQQKESSGSVQPMVQPQPSLETLPRAQATPATEMERPGPAEIISQPTQSTPQVVPVPTPSGGKQKTIDSYNLEDDNLITLLRAKGLSSL